MEVEDEVFTSPFLELERPSRWLKKRGDFWAGLATISTGAAIMGNWEWACGSAVELVKPFLRPTPERAEHYPCPDVSPCGCYHEIVDGSFGLVACCTCGEGCESFRAEPADLLVHRLDLAEVGEGVRRALGFEPASGVAYAREGWREIGAYGAIRAPVHLSLSQTDELLRELHRLMGLRDGPFVLLTPTGSAWNADVEATLHGRAVAHVSLSSVLEVGPAKAFTRKANCETVLADFMKRATAIRDDGGTLRNIHREIAAVRSEYVELRSAKQRLEKMLADGLFAFTQKVDPASFKVLCTILAEGDIAKAGRSLDLPQETVRAAVRRWEGKGKEYRAMLELVRWRKKVGGKGKVPLNDSIVHERAQTVDFPGLLADVLDGLLSMTDQNWAEQCEVLTELLRPVVAAARN